MTISKKLSIFLFVIWLASCAACVFSARLASDNPKAVLIVVDYTSLSDLTVNAPPALAKLVSHSGIGLISPGAGRTGTAESAYATTSAGGYCWANSDIDEAFTRKEVIPDELDDAVTIYKRRTGKDGNPSVAQLDLNTIDQSNIEHFATSLPGALADALYRSGKKTAVFGNSDTADKLRRRASIVAATSKGEIAFGDVSTDILRPEPFSPTGVMTDSKRLALLVNNSLKSADFVVVDFGDMARVELCKKQLSEKAYNSHRRNALKNLDSFLDGLTSGRADNSTIILASMASPFVEKGEHRRLSPIVVHHPDGAFGSVIANTTRTPALVSCIDIAPTVLNALGVEKSGGMVGSDITVVQDRGDAARRLDDMVIMNRDAEWIVMGVLAAIGIIAVSITCLAVALGKWNRGLIGAILRVLMVLVASSPIATFFSTVGKPAFIPYVERIAVWMVLLTISSFIIAQIVKHLMGDRLKKLPGALPLVVLMLFTSTVLLIEAFRGGELIRYSLFSAGAFRGFRFYGVGNEFMGIWLGMALVSIIWIRECFSNWQNDFLAKCVLVIASALIMVALGLPRLGANAGGCVSAVIGLGLAYWSGLKNKLTVRSVIVFTILAFGFVGAIGVFDMLTARSAPSHIGLAASMTEHSGWQFIASMALRKIGMNFMLLLTKQAEVALAGSIPFFILWFSYIRPKLRVMFEDRPAFRLGIISSFICAAAAFLFNDSGSVAGGLVFGFVVLAVLYSMLDEDAKSKPSLETKWEE